MSNLQWDEDFSYNFLKILYKEISANFRIALLQEAPQLVKQQKPVAFIRHDLDVSLTKARQLAELENESGIISTYHVMVDNPFYEVKKESSVLKDIKSLGHEIGLHYDVQARNMLEATEVQRRLSISQTCAELSDITGQEVKSVSFHRPVKELLNGPLLLDNRVSAYGSELFKWYLSDSQARWREGNPLESLKKPRSHILQILVHPIWWGENKITPKQRLTEFIRSLSSGANYNELNELMWNHIAFRGENEL